MNFNLIVVAAFATYNVGDRITDPDAMSAALASNPSSVVKVAAPNVTAAPAPASSNSKGN